jgi:hypothetical protein
MLSRRLFAQVLRDFSFQTAAPSTPANPLRNDLDEPQTSDDGQSNKQIKIFFRHCPCVSVRRQSNAGTVLHNWTLTSTIGAEVLKSRIVPSSGMPDSIIQVRTVGVSAR